jgi:branched-chain amino acid transport system permease protein
VTGGEDGLLNIARLPATLGPWGFTLRDNYHLFYFVLAVFVLAVVLLWRVVHSPFGKVLQAIRQNETRTRFLGYPVWLYKWAAFTISAGVAGLAGGLFALAQESAYVQVMSLQWSGIIVLMTLIGGGMVSFWGPVVGAIVFFLARDVLGALTEAWLLWYGLMFMLIIMFKPEGLAGLYRELLRRVRTPRQGQPARLTHVFWR